MLLIKTARTERGLSQQSLANAIGVSRSTIAMWETGASQPDNDALRSLADYFNVTVDYLLGRTDNPAPIHAGETEKEEHKENPLDDPDISDYLFAFHGEIRDLDEDDQKTIADMIRFMQARKKEKQGEKENM